MNKNPLLIKNFLMGKIPFMKEKTEYLYKKYLSNHKFSKKSDEVIETISAYTLGSTYETDFVFDLADIHPNIHFTEKEWILLGMLLRAYKEVESIRLMHLYNCLYSGSGNTVRGHVVTGRTYTLYTWSQLGATIRIDGEIYDYGVKKQLTAHTPLIIKVPEKVVEQLVEITIEFNGLTYQRVALFEGSYAGIFDYNQKNTDLIPRLLGIGEYSDRLVEFFAGTLITPLSDSKLIKSVTWDLGISSLGDPVKEIHPGWHEKDGYIGKEIS